MERNKAVFSLIVVFVYVFAIGTVTAFSPQPGSADDPLITKSYVDMVLAPANEQIVELKLKIEEQAGEIVSLTQELAQAHTMLKELTERVTTLEGIPQATPVAPAPVIPAPAPTVYGYINGSWVNIRSGPGTNHSVVVVLANNTRVEVVERGQEWHKIKYNDRIAYVYAPLLRIP